MLLRAGKKYIIEKKIKIETKYRWETLDVIPLFPLPGVNHCQPIVHMSKIIVHIYSTDKHINKFAIGYIINPSLHVNKVFREKVEKCLNYIFH